MPAASRIRATATPAAPAPEITTRVSSWRRPVSASAPSRAARTTTAVPCWSSWKTGMESRSWSRCSISKQRGARDVLEVDPAEGRRQTHHGLDDLVGVRGVEADRDRVHAAELLEQHRLALHDRHRRRRPDVTQAQHRGAVGDHGDGVGDPGVVAHQRGVGGDRLAHLGHPGGVGQRQIVTIVQRDRAGDGHLPALVQRENRRGGTGRGPIGSSHSGVGRGGGRGHGVAAGFREGIANGGSVGWWDPWEGSAVVPGRPAGRSVWHRPAPPPRPDPPSTRATTRSSGTAPTSQESTPSRGLSRSTHQPPGSRRTARFTATVPSGRRTTTRPPGPGPTAVDDEQQVARDQGRQHGPSVDTRQTEPPSSLHRTSTCLSPPQGVSPSGLFLSRPHGRCATE